MKKKTCLLLASSLCAILSLTGCSSKSEDTTMTDADKKIYSLHTKDLELEEKIDDLERQITVLKSSMNVSTEAKVTGDEVKLSSIKVVTINGEKENKVVTLAANSKVGLKISVMNASEANLNQYVCQAYVKYISNGQTVDVYQNSVNFDALPKSIQKNIEFKNIQIKNQNVKHVLMVKVKDQYGNIITTFEKELKVK